MSLVEQIAQFWILVPVAILLLAGFAITVQAGHARLGDIQGLRKFVGNLSSTIAMIGVCLLVLMMMQGIVGYNLKATW